MLIFSKSKLNFVINKLNGLIPVKSAHISSKADFLPNQETYVAISVDGQPSKKTAVCKKTRDPTYDEDITLLSFTFDLF